METPSDSYLTIEAPAEALYKDKGSRFLAFAYPVANEEQIRERVDALRKKYFDATHHCYAWRLGPSGDSFRAVDDGEPSSTAGRPILGQMLSRNVTNALIVVVRYFGGTKLGVPGLIAAYRESAAAALDAMALAGARVQQIEAAMNMWQKAQAGLELARKTYERVQNLYNDGVVPAQKLDEATANYKAMEATALAAKAQYDMATDGARKEDKEAAAARVRQAEGAVSEVESYISDAMVYSPVTGEISTIIAEEGELVGSGYPVVAILDMSDLWVTFNVKETLLPGLRIGTRMNGYVPALDSDVEFEVTYISPQADFATWSATRTQGGFDIRTFAIKAKAVTEAANMRPGMSVLVDWDQIGK